MRTPKIAKSITPVSKARRPFSSNAMSAAAAISFSLTFVVAIAAFALGLVPALNFGGSIETGVVLLFVPLCALVFAILVEAVRGSLARSFKPEAPPTANLLAAWRPGHGEG